MTTRNARLPRGETTFGDARRPSGELVRLIEEQGVPCIGYRAEGIPGEIAACWVTPAITHILQVQQIVIANQSAASQLYIVTIASQRSIDIVGRNATIPLDDLASWDASTKRPSTMGNGSHAAILGASIIPIRVPVGDTRVVKLPRHGIILHGDGPNGPASCCVWQTVITEEVRVSFICREVPVQRFPIGG